MEELYVCIYQIDSMHYLFEVTPRPFQGTRGDGGVLRYVSRPFADQQSAEQYHTVLTQQSDDKLQKIINHVWL